MSHQYGPPPGQQPNPAPYGQPPYNQQPQQGGPYGYAPQPAPAPRNGLGLAALICGGVGVLFGFVAIGFVVAGPLAIVAIALGLVGMSRAQKGAATNGGVATIGMLLGVAAAAMSIWGASRVFSAVDDARNQLGDTQQRVECMEKTTTAEEIWACAQ